MEIPLYVEMRNNIYNIWKFEKKLGVGKNSIFRKYRFHKKNKIIGGVQ